ncbi:MAG: PilZ domain-containing protein [Acidobacteria bacterium]|nr:PilZ domain-containing protein [Acidobacteriota bacterium]
MDEQILQDQRRFQRFDLKLPVELTRTGTRRLSRAGQTRNLSSGGILFTVQSSVQVGEPIEYCITLPSATEPDVGVRLRCRGKVTRLEQAEKEDPASPSPVCVAATLERYEFVRRPAPPQT